MTDDTQLLRDAAEQARALPDDLAHLIRWYLGLGNEAVTGEIRDPEVTPADVARAVLAMPAPDRNAMDAMIIEAWRPFGAGSPVLQQRRRQQAKVAVDALIAHGYINDRPSALQARIDAARAALLQGGQLPEDRCRAAYVALSGEGDDRG